MYASKMYIILLILYIQYCESTLTVDYIQNVIKENTESAKNYKFPTKYEEFERGARSTILNEFDDEYYDFVIVGAGSAGSVLATRLSEVPHWKILLIEAGGEEDLFNRIPGMLLYTQFSKRNWGFFSTPQKNCCLGMENQMCIEPRGKGIGGSSSINVLTYARGNPEDYNKWANLGCPNWSYSSILKYFIKSENCQIDGDMDYHGYGGLLNVQYSRPPTSAFDSFIDANEELGLRFLDYNGREQIGVSRVQFNTIRGLRQSTGTAFLDYARERRNLRVVTEALVTKIIIDQTSKEAQGVIFIKNDRKYKVRAKIEVIVSGGAFNSPQLLMLSGIGPANHLKEMNISVISDLPVGENLMEHPVFQGMVFHTNSTQGDTNQTRDIEQLLRREGPLTHPLNSDVVSFTRSDTPAKNSPDLEYLFIQFGTPVDILGRGYNFNERMSKSFVSNINFFSDLVIYLVLLHPESRGKITLKSNDPTDMPNIDLNMFDKPKDIQRLIIGIRRILRLSKTEAFRKLNATLIDIPICTTHQKFSDQYWKCMIQNMASTLYHPAGTCSMGPSRKTSVVDCEFKVHGIKKLRVVDASAIPVTIAGHLNAPTVMMAEKASDLIKINYKVANASSVDYQICG